MESRGLAPLVENQRLERAGSERSECWEGTWNPCRGYYSAIYLRWSEGRPQ
ncbi:MAG: hypothetical protein PHU81_02080 [Acidobacteriota bacterium]|nr:hypothetical protein [Acidobacteriota bacterium]